MNKKCIDFFKNPEGQWAHPDISILMDLADSDEQPEALIRRLCRVWLQQVSKHGWSGPPYDPFSLARLKGLHLCSRPPLFAGKYAELTIRPNQSLELQYNSDGDAARVHFEVSRLIVQSLLPNCHEMIRRQESPYYLPEPSMDLECLLDTGAAEFLLPEQSFMADLAELNFSSAAAVQLAGRYQAPLEAVLIRIAQLSLLPYALVFVSERRARKSRAAEMSMEFDFGLDPQPHAQKLRVDYVIGPENLKSIIPKDKAIFEGTALYKCLQSGAAIEDFERWDHDHGMHRVVACRLFSADPRNPRRAAALVKSE